MERATRALLWKLSSLKDRSISSSKVEAHSPMPNDTLVYAPSSSATATAATTDRLSVPTFPTISYREFLLDQVVLFMPIQGNVKVYAAFHVRCPNYFLSDTCRKRILRSKGINIFIY